MPLEARGVWELLCVCEGGAQLLCLPQDSRAGRLSFCTKVCYGIGGVPNQVASSATAFYLQLFLLDVAQVSVGISPGPPFPSSMASGPSSPTTVHRQHFQPKLWRATSSRVFIAACL